MGALVAGTDPLSVRAQTELALALLGPAQQRRADPAAFIVGSHRDQCPGPADRGVTDDATVIGLDHGGVVFEGEVSQPP